MTTKEKAGFNELWNAVSAGDQERADAIRAEMNSPETNTETTSTSTENVDISTITKEMKLEAAYEVLHDKRLVKDMIKAHNIKNYELASFIDTIYECINDKIKAYIDKTNSEKNTKRPAVDAIFNAIATITFNSKKEDLVFQTLMHYGNESQKSANVSAYIASFEEMIVTLKSCKEEFDKEDKLKEVEALMEKLGLDPVKSLMALKEKKKAAGITTTTTTKKPAVTFAHYFLNEKGEVKTANLSDRGMIAKDLVGNPARFFDWVTGTDSSSKFKMKRKDFRFDKSYNNMTEKGIMELSDEYLAYLKKLGVTEPAVTEPTVTEPTELNEVTQ